MSRSLRFLVTVFLSAVASGGEGTAAKARHVPASDVPEWIREAAARPVPTTDADLVILHEEMVVEPLAAGGVRVTQRYAAKCLRQRGLEDLARRMVHYQKDDRVESLRAWTLLPDGSAQVPHPANDYGDYPAISVSGISIYEDNRVRVVGVPGVAVGRVVAFESVVVEKLDWGAKSWQFGDADRPTLLSRLTLRVPRGWRFEPATFRADGLEKLESPDGFTFSGHDLEPLARVELRPPAETLLPEVWARWFSPDGVRGFRDWDAFGRHFWDLASPVLSDRGEADSVAAALKTRESEGVMGTLRAAFGYVARQIRYVSIQIGIGGWKPDSPAAVCRKKYGDCKAKSFLLMSLLDPSGLKAFPVIVRTRRIGALLPGVPGNQFDHAITAVVLPDDIGSDLWATAHVEGIGRALFLDGTDSTGRAWDLPEMDQGTLALLVHPAGGKLVRLPVQPPEAATVRRTLSAKLEATGAIDEATLVESWDGTRASSVRSQLVGLSVEERRRWLLQGLHERLSGAVPGEWRIDGLDGVEAPLVVSVRFRGGRLGRSVGGLLIVEPGRLARGVLSTRLPPPPRGWPLYLSASPHREVVEVRLTLPEGLAPEELPRATEVDQDDIDARAEWEISAGTLVYRRTARLKALEVPPERYEAFRAALHRIQAEDARSVVLVKR